LGPGLGNFVCLLHKHLAMSHKPSKHNFFDEGGVAAVGYLYVIFAILSIVAMLYF